MSLTLPDPTRNAIVDSVTGLIDAGSGPGYIQIRQTAAVLAEVACDDPAFGAAVAGTATGNPIDDAATATGTANQFTVFDANDQAVISGVPNSGTCTLSTAARNAACAARTQLVDAGDGGAGLGYIELRAGLTVLAVVTLQNPAFGAPANGSAVLLGTPLPFVGLPAAGAGTNADNYRVCDSEDNVRWSGVVGLAGSGADLILGNVSIAEDQPGTIDSWTTSQPANCAGGLALRNLSITNGQPVEIESLSISIPAS